MAAQQTTAGAEQDRQEREEHDVLLFHRIPVPAVPARGDVDVPERVPSCEHVLQRIGGHTPQRVRVRGRPVLADHRGDQTKQEHACTADDERGGDGAQGRGKRGRG